MFQELAVNIKVRGREAGSGSLYQSSLSEYTFVITAKHCLLGKEKIEPKIDDLSIQRDNDIGSNNFLEVVRFILYPTDEHDFAIILVKRIEGVPSIMIGSPKRGNDVVFYGYPHIFASAEQKGIPLNAKINSIYPTTKKFDIQTETGLFTFTNEAIDNVAGFSGSGIYYEYDNHIVLTGIIIKLRDTGGVFNLITAESINEIGRFIESILACRLVPFLLNSFDNYVQSTFRKYGDHAHLYFNRFYKTGIQEITPFLILEKLKGKLFIPPLLGELNEINLQETVLWSGWSKVLTFMHISTQEIINLENVVKYLYLGQEIASTSEEIMSNSPMIRMLYTFQLETISDCIKQLFLNEEMYKSINLNDNVIINSQQSFATKIVTKDQIKGIVSNIDEGELFQSRININDPNIYKNINIFHLDAFDLKFNQIGIEFCSISELEIKIQSSINEVLKNDY